MIASLDERSALRALRSMSVPYSRNLKQETGLRSFHGLVVVLHQSPEGCSSRPERPLINPPQAAILSVGRFRQEAVVENGSIVARDVVGLGLTFDHRVADGAEAGKFLASLVKTLENPVLD